MSTTTTNTVRFGKSLAAYQAGNRARLDLCKALAEEIPYSATGVHNGRQETLSACAEYLTRESGEPISWHTLDMYRKVGAWVGENDWLSGYSYTAHREGFNSGKSFAEWAVDPTATRRVRLTEVQAQTVEDRPLVFEPLGRGYVYLWADPRIQGESRVGMTDNLVLRAASHRRGSRLGEMVRVIKVTDMRRAERLLHDALAGHCIEDDWFAIDPEKFDTVVETLRAVTGDLYGEEI